MRFIFTVTGVTKLNGEKLLVQFAGKYGNLQLNLPLDQQEGFRVGDEFTLANQGGIGFVGVIDEVQERETEIATAHRVADTMTQGGLAALSGKPLGGRKIRLED
jgi:hypothetical protein